MADREIETITYAELTAERIEKLGKPHYWGEPDRERYHCETIDEAMQDLLDWVDDPWVVATPKTVELVAMVPTPVAPPDPDDILERELEILDENYGDPDGDSTEPSEAMKAAAQALCEAIARDYVGWSCQQALRVTVDVGEWKKAHPAAEKVAQ